MTLAVNIAQIGSNNTTFRNRIINGAMVIDQRNAGASAPTNSGNDVYTLDRWRAVYGVQNKYTVQQNAGGLTGANLPSGFKNYLGVTSSAATSTGAGDIYHIGQAIEGFNVSDLGWGAAGAATITLSFWVRSSLTGTFGGSLQNSAVNRSYPFTFTISAANTFEYKTVTIAGDTSGTWLTTNGIGITIRFNLGTGSTYSGTAGAWAAADYRSATGATSVLATNGATFYITGVQLEAGTTASPFEYRPYGTELALCYRYYQTNPQTMAVAIATNVLLFQAWFSLPMRAMPELSLTTTSPYIENNPWATVSTTSGFTVSNGHMSTLGGDVRCSGTMSGVVANQNIIFGGSQVRFSSEL